MYVYTSIKLPCSEITSQAKLKFITTISRPKSNIVTKPSDLYQYLDFRFGKNLRKKFELDSYVSVPYKITVFGRKQLVG